MRTAAAVLVIGLMLGIAALAVFGDWDAATTDDPAATARQHERDLRFYGVVFCEQQVRNQLVNPRSAQFRGGTGHGRILGGDSVLVTSWVDAGNRMGGTVRHGFECLIERTGGSGSGIRWQLHELHID